MLAICDIENGQIKNHVHFGPDVDLVEETKNPTLFMALYVLPALEALGLIPRHTPMSAEEGFARLKEN